MRFMSKFQKDPFKTHFVGTKQNFKVFKFDFYPYTSKASGNTKMLKF